MLFNIEIPMGNDDFDGIEYSGWKNKRFMIN